MPARLAAIALGLSIAGGLSLAAQSQPASTPPPTTELADAFPGSAKVDQFVLSADGQRTYFVSATGEVSLFDHVRKTTTRIAAGPVWDINLSPTGDALAYTKAGAERGDEFVWVLALDSATGLPRGAERQLSPHQGDVPSIAPDGKVVAFARDEATGAGQSLVVVPLAGGAERVVVAGIPSSLANIRWTPDGKTLYFGVNAPVPCVPGWSCLPLKPELQQPMGRIRRVAVVGGQVTEVATARGLTPGLSPDGTTLMYLDAGAPAAARRWVVSNADGTRRATFTLPPAQTLVGWLRGSTAIVTSGGGVRRLRTIPLAGGTSRVLADDAEQLFEPSWSPDGTLMMTIARTAPHSELRIQNADGTAPRTIPLPEQYAYGSAWSPDQKRVAYIGLSDTDRPRVAVVDFATGRSASIYEIANEQSVSLRWLADSRGLVLTEMFGRPDTARRVVFRTVDLDGTTTVLREIALGQSSSVGLGVDDDVAVVKPGPQDGYRVVHLKGDGPDRDLLPSPPRGASLASLSADGQWLTLRHDPAPADGTMGTILELVRVDGGAHHAVSVPFQVGVNPKIIPGGPAELLVLEASRPGEDSGVYVVSGATQPPRKLFAYSMGNAPPELAISPDGRTLLYVIWETVPPSVRTMDLSAVRGR